MSWFKRLKEQSAEIPDGIKQLDEYNRILAKLTAEQRAEIREKVFAYWLANEWDLWEQKSGIVCYLMGYINALAGAETITHEERNALIDFIQRCKNIEVDWNWCDNESEAGRRKADVKIHPREG